MQSGFLIPPLTDQLPEGAALFMIAGPIGNLADITVRALQILSCVDLVLCEDTRKSAILLQQYGIQTRRLSFRIHQLRSDIDRAMRSLEQGEKIAFLTDAGTPGISDPGYELVRTLLERLPAVPIVALPGPSAVTTAVSISGYSGSPLHFYGFLPRKAGQRQSLLAVAQELNGILVFYESVHRIEKSLLELHQSLAGRDVTVFRELTKVFEERIFIPAEITEDALAEKLMHLRKKGEFTIIAGPKK
ncbi:MAG: 16S rRNA (cytidine(1402)-2'-O)-methyltransferase [Leptospiraceae bacterium]|nr:16S rRNA (cytidine(1402)-2'-O)-methyltransferase [Leptospiraceae bacterium]